MFKKISSIKVFLLLVFLSLPSMVYLLIPGFYEPHDLHHFADIYEMYRAFSSGQIPPRLGPDFIFGYGYPLFNFYYVLPFYLGSLFFAAFKSIQFSFELVFVVSIVISVFGMYLFLREFFGKFAEQSFFCTRLTERSKYMCEERWGKRLRYRFCLLFCGRRFD
ncbi:MAG: hypothetical protein UT23_C0025G0002 [Candidatus Woesebacteria bacterium GW2011_GWA1_39_12]|uniref:Membrane protein 6-pyruvoyl-tetrahydropterin synthase-related domain-containing protein n=1 Tax=Candidatus Woesebacteria bacterium GW2011_GWA1_39_12 TaxID=1618549 RepID=A0A0G0Q535_9BACT|nr:MAG: hypothetical protein UT23_C0025G0002 [Candidatus Woesebacteria bacterium GW2011_GWA1_39_12]